MKYWQRKINDRIKEMKFPEVDPAEVEEFIRATHDTLNYLEEDQLRKEIRIAVYAIHSGALEEMVNDCKNYYGFDVGCAVPPGRTPPDFGPEITPEGLKAYLKTS